MAVVFVRSVDEFNQLFPNGAVPPPMYAAAAPWAASQQHAAMAAAMTAGQQAQQATPFPRPTDHLCISSFRATPDQQQMPGRMMAIPMSMSHMRPDVALPPGMTLGAAGAISAPRAMMMTGNTAAATAMMPAGAQHAIAAPTMRVQRRVGRTRIETKWPDEFLLQSTKDINQALKASNMTRDEIRALKQARRRLKNRLYARDSRARKSNPSSTSFQQEEDGEFDDGEMMMDGESSEPGSPLLESSGDTSPMPVGVVAGGSGVGGPVVPMVAPVPWPQPAMVNLQPPRGSDFPVVLAPAAPQGARACVMLPACPALAPARSSSAASLPTTAPMPSSSSTAASVSVAAPASPASTASPTSPRAPTAPSAAMKQEEAAAASTTTTAAAAATAAADAQDAVEDVQPPRPTPVSSAGEQLAASVLCELGRGARVSSASSGARPIATTGPGYMMSMPAAIPAFTMAHHPSAALLAASQVQHIPPLTHYSQLPPPLQPIPHMMAMAGPPPAMALRRDAVHPGQPQPQPQPQFVQFPGQPGVFYAPAGMRYGGYVC